MTHSVDERASGRLPNGCSHTAFAELTGSLGARLNPSKSLKGNLRPWILVLHLSKQIMKRCDCADCDRNEPD